MGINYFEEIKKVAPLNTWVELDSLPVIFVNVLISKKIYFTNDYKNFYRDNDSKRVCQFNCGVRDLKLAKWFKDLYIAITGKEADRSTPEGNSKLKEELKNHPRILDLALKRLDCGGDPGLTTAFSWCKTPEGHDFWLDIRRKRYQAFYDKFGGLNPDSVGTADISPEPLTRSKNVTVADVLKDRRDLQELYQLEQDAQDVERNLDVDKMASRGEGGLLWYKSKCGQVFWGRILEQNNLPSEAEVAAQFRAHFMEDHIDRATKQVEMKEIDPLEDIMDSLQVKTLTVF
jgi:hypothetical protein